MNHSMQLTRRLSNEHPHRQCSSIEFRPSQLKQRFSVLFFCVATSLCAMWTEEPKDLLKGVDWKNVGGDVSNQSTSTTAPVTKKRIPKKIRQVPEYYFLPRRSLPSAIAVYGSIIAAGVGAGMLVEIWINKKIAEDGGVIWELDK